MFTSINRDFRSWEKGDRSSPPPVLPLIALSVLAATKMRSDSQASSTNYYLRLAEALLPKSTSEEQARLRAHLREGDGFLDVVKMWRGLHRWIEINIGVGASTIREHPRFQRIGYPLSQALVRHSDRTKLTRFFSDLAFPIGHPPTQEELIAALQVWSTTERNRLTETLMRSLGEPGIRPLLAQVVEALARSWDGLILNTDGNVRIAIRIGIDLDSWTSTVLLPVPQGGPEELQLWDANGLHYNFYSTPGYNYYLTTDSIPTAQTALRTGLKLTGDAHSAQVSPLSIVACSPDPQTGSWSSTEGFVPFEEHLVAVDLKHQRDFESILHHAADEGWRRMPQRRSALIEGFALYKDVRFTDGKKLEDALSRFPALRRAGVAPATTPRARLVRGLPIASRLSSKHYLVGGEPDLLLPSASEPYMARVTLNGSSQNFWANGFPIEIRRLAEPAGRHILEVASQKLSFTTLCEDPASDPVEGSASLGWSSDLTLTENRDDFSLTGALTKTTQQTNTVLGRRGREESWILCDNGKAEKIREPSEPAFLHTLDIDIHLPHFEVALHHRARWLAQRRGTTWHLTQVNAERQREHVLNFDVLEAWERACTNENARKLWNHLLGNEVNTE